MADRVRRAQRAPARRTSRSIWANKIRADVSLGSGITAVENLLENLPGTLKIDATVLDVEVILNLSHVPGTADKRYNYWSGLYIAEEGLVEAQLPQPDLDDQEVDWMHRWHFASTAQGTATVRATGTIHQEDKIKTKRRFRENGKTLFYIEKNDGPDPVFVSHLFRTLLFVP